MFVLHVAKQGNQRVTALEKYKRRINIIEIEKVAENGKSREQCRKMVK